MSILKDIIFNTPRLTLRPPALKDVMSMSKILNDTRTMKYLRYLTITGEEWTLEATSKRIQQQIESTMHDTGQAFHIFNKANDELIGASGFPELSLNNHTGIFGIILSQTVWDNAFSTEIHLQC